MKKPLLNVVFCSASFFLAGCQTPPLLKDSSVALEVYVLPVTIDGHAVNMDEAADVRLVLGSQGYLKFLDTELNSVIPLKQKRMS